MLFAPSLDFSLVPCTVLLSAGWHRMLRLTHFPPPHCGRTLLMPSLFSSIMSAAIVNRCADAGKDYNKAQGCASNEMSLWLYLSAPVLAMPNLHVHTPFVAHRTPPRHSTHLCFLFSGDAPDLFLILAPPCPARRLRNASVISWKTPECGAAGLQCFCRTGPGRRRNRQAGRTCWRDE